jgi:amidohydrolase
MKLLSALAVIAQVSCISLAAAQSPAWLDTDTTAAHPKVIELRRDFHANPELSNAEERTARVVAERLRALGLEVKTGVAKHGVVALLKGGKPGKCVAVRADMDALPIEEAGNAPFKSTYPGVMHACGHDAHTAIALGVAEVLAKHRDELAGSVKFIFQPAEESMPASFRGEWGAKLMLAEGALENPVPSAIFALHCAPLVTVLNAAGQREDRPLVAGQMGFGSGAISANSDRFGITVEGKMAHGSAPHRGVDSILVAAEIIQGLQAIRSRHIDPQEPLVVSVGRINGGARDNIIAKRVEMSGTVRTASTKTQDRVIELINQIASRIAEAHGATAKVAYRKGYPAVINDPALVKTMLPTLERVLGKENLFPTLPSMGGEDFSFFAQKVPGFYLRLGTARPGVEKPAGIHTPDFDLDEASLLTGTRAITALVLESLAQP